MAMQTTFSLPAKRPRDPPPFLGGALGATVLMLSLLAVALPILGATYLGQFRHSSVIAAPTALRAPAATAAMPSPQPQASPDAGQPGQSSNASPPTPSPALAQSLATAPSQAAIAPPPAVSSPVASAAPSPAPDAAVMPRHGVTQGMDSVVDIAFAPGSAKLPNEHRGELTEIASLYRKHGGMVRIVGYGEAANGREGTEQSTFGLALDRARAVAVALSQLGVAPGDLQVEAAPLQSIPSGNSLGAGAEVIIIRS
jgi:outer membrane protein OmpA-like peptidoglycan-associated protein